MNREELRNMAKETMQISRKEYYYLNGEKIYLSLMNNGYSYEDVIVFDKKRLDAIENDDDGFFRENDFGTRDATFYLANGDSFQMAQELDRPVVMNFANALRPGGGFLNGARAQEESLCRNRSLYHSISSYKAMEMYVYNTKHLNPLDSDYMLLSPNVCVFRDPNGNLLQKPYNVSVVTIAAPNKNGRAKGVKQETLDDIMEYRLRRMLYAAARYGYKDLVLGAWGCGAFGHDTEKVAGYFYKLFFEEEFKKYFDNVVFAVLNDDAKLADFRKVFGDKMEDLTVYGCVSSEANEMYQEVSRAFPVCNHIHSIKDNNLGYTQGIMQSGIPFEAELWRNETSRNLSVVIPEIYKSVDSSGHTLNNENVLGFHTQVKRLHDGVLTTGMEDRGEVSDLDVTIWYVNFLQEHGIVVFTDKMENGSVSLTTDIEGNNLAYITVTLEEGGRTYATTDLKFMSFPYQPKKTTDRVLRVVK